MTHTPLYASPEPALARTNHRIRRELLPHFYRHCTFDLRLTPAGRRDEWTFTPSTLRALHRAASHGLARFQLSCAPPRIASDAHLAPPQRLAVCAMEVGTRRVEVYQERAMTGTRLGCARREEQRRMRRVEAAVGWAMVGLVGADGWDERGLWRRQDCVTLKDAFAQAWYWAGDCER